MDLCFGAARCSLQIAPLCPRVQEVDGCASSEEGSCGSDVGEDGEGSHMEAVDVQHCAAVHR